MKKFKWLLSIVMITAATLAVLQSCDDSKQGECTNKISQSGDDESHRNGENCMSCHVAGGSGEGCFIVAGSVYDNTQTNPVNSGTVNLHTGPNGTGSLIATIQVDSKGNFYTTDQVNFGAGVYPSYTNTSGQTNYMGSSIATGQCGSCHNVITGKIFAP